MTQQGAGLHHGGEEADQHGEPGRLPPPALLPGPHRPPPYAASTFGTAEANDTPTNTRATQPTTPAAP
ncbi:hypothetical protein ACFQZC_03580 [Streptacidiphilus monticola]